MLPGGGQDRVSRPPGRVRAALCGRLGGPRGHHPLAAGWSRPTPPRPAGGFASLRAVHRRLPRGKDL